MYPEFEGDKIKLYGTIFKGDAQWIISQLAPHLNEEGKEVFIKVHCDGGDIMDGNVIFNAIQNAKANVTFEIDGLSASMMAIIMLAGAKIRIAPNALVMIHGPQGTISGDLQKVEGVAKLMRAIQNTFKNVLVNKTGKTIKEVEKWLQNDTWFSAEEALEAGIVDEIMPAKIIDMPKVEALQDVSLVAQLMSEYQTQAPTTPTSANKQITNTNKEMKLSAESQQKLGLTAEASDTEINAAIAKLHEKVARMEDEKATELKAKATKLIEAAVTTGKVSAGEKDQYITNAIANFDMVAGMLEKVPAKGDGLNGQRQGDPAEVENLEARKNWTFDDYRKKDTPALLAMKANDPDKYQALLDANNSMK